MKFNFKGPYFLAWCEIWESDLVFPVKIGEIKLQIKWTEID